MNKRGQLNSTMQTKPLNSPGKSTSLNTKKPPQPELEQAQIKKIGVLSFALTFALIGLIVGIILDIFYAISISGMIASLSSAIPQATTILGGFATITLVIIPFAYAFMSFLSGLLFGALYNLSSKLTKGVKIYAG